MVVVERFCVFLKKLENSFHSMMFWLPKYHQTDFNLS